MEKGIPFDEFNLIGFKNTTATERELKKHWKNKINLNNFWYGLCGLFKGDFFTYVALFLYWIISLIGIVGFIQFLFGFTSNGFYKFLFDPLTVNILFFQFILFFVLNFSILGLLGNKLNPNLWLYSTWGIILIVSFFELLNLYFLRKIFIISIIVSLLIPFHSILFNILFFLHFFIFGADYYDRNRINFALFNISNIKKVYKFLNEPYSNK